LKLKTYTYHKDNWDDSFDSTFNTQETLVIIFGSANITCIKEPLKDITGFFSKATIVGASTAGEIIKDELYDDSLVAVVMHFSDTRICAMYEPLKEESAYDIGQKVSKKLLDDELKAMFVLSDGLKINGSQLTEGIFSVVGHDVVVTGGLAGDGDRFEHTWTLVNGEPTEGYVSAVGFYGDAITVKHGSKGGWDSLGVERLVTKSTDNVLYELDNQPALEIYKKYLGDKAEGLPATGLLFPLELRDTLNATERKVRTILGVNEENHSITFAGDIPEGAYVTLMKANYDRLIDGATSAADDILLEEYNGEEVLSLAISCVGRRLVLKQRTEEELEATLDVLPTNVQQIGFYSYGEISPLSSGQCDLHNQTMTLTVMWEKDAPVT